MNKFRKLFLSLIIMFVCSLGLILDINAAEANNGLINLDTIRLEVEGVSDTSQQYAYIRIYDSGFEDDVTYVATFTKDTDSVKTQLSVTDDSVILSDLELEDDTIIKNAIFSSVAYLPVAEKYGDIYVTFYTPDSDNAGKYKKISDPILVKKPENLKISKRFHVYAWEDETSIYYYNLGSISTKRSANYKVGVVNDNTILNQIKEGNYAGLESLLTFAKNDKNSVSSGRIEIKSTQSPLYQQADLVEGAYYYIYLDLDTEEGMYYQLDDVNLYQCRKTFDNELWLVDVDDSKFEWNLEETLWDKFVEEYKKTDLVKMYDDSEFQLQITSTDDSLSVVLTNEDETFTTNFIYENGILKYESDSKEDEMIFSDSIWQMNAIVALCELKGYDIDKVSKWLEENEDKVLTLENDGIEYISKDYHYKEDKDGVSTTINATILTSFELDIQNGLKSYNEDQIYNYEFISGENQKYTVNKTKELKVEIDATYSLFEGVHVNGKLLDATNYTVTQGSEGSTIVVLKKEYLDTLNNGVHTLKTTFKDGEYAQTNFTVEKTIKNPSTRIGITSGILLLGLIFVGIYLITRKQSKFPKHN